MFKIIIRKSHVLAALLLAVLSLHSVAADYTSTDIAASGGSTTAVGNDGFDIVGGGSDIWFDNDHFRFVYRKVEGDFDISVHLTSLQQQNPWTKAGLMVRQNLDSGSAYLDALMASNSQLVYQHRAQAGRMSTSTNSDHTRTGSCWFRITRIQDFFIIYRSSDGVNWLPMGMMQFEMKSPVLVGMCVCSHLEGSTSKATFRNLKFTTDVELPDFELPPGVADQMKVKSKPTIQSRQISNPAPAAPAAYQATDKALAAALAAGAAKLAGDGKTDKAKELCYKSLANDENCADALYELAKIFEKENNPKAAADFFVRASREMAQSAEVPAVATKRADADRRVMKLNPHATRFNAIMTDYAAELGAIAKRTKDTLTQEEASDRIMQLRLPSILPPDKIPQFAAPATTNKTSNGRLAANVPPDVERALKSAGWDKVSGNWKKVAENVYEVNNGKLETAKTNGAIQVTVMKGGSGSVKALVRNSISDYASSYYSYASGYGGKIESGTCKLFTPYNPYSSNTVFRPYLEREINLPDVFPKNQLLVTVNETQLEIHVNGKREKVANYKISKEGPFIIEIEGTMTIESPMAKGQ